MSTLPAQAAAQGKQPMYTREQFAPIGRLSSDPCVVFVQKSAPWNTLAELIADAKKRPDEIIYISTGPYGPTHLPMEMLMKATNTSFRHLPTTGGGPAVNMLLSGGGHIFFSVPGLGAQHVAAGTFKVLAAANPTRVPEFPDVPTMKELDIDMEYTVWSAMFTPAGVPVEIQRQLDAAVTRAAADPAVLEAFKKSGTPLAHQNQATFRKWWDEDTKRLESIIKVIVEKEKTTRK
jgi:tripartite-type tricarboxylate transporter receptor subunit TctC